MILTITSIELRSPWHFFSLSWQALKISRQLKESGCLQFRKKGFWKKHYTMALWACKEDMKKFANSGYHFQAMKKSGKIASEIRTLTRESDEMPDWNKAQKILSESSPILFRRK